MAFIFYYQGAKGDRGMTGDAGEKGEQVKTECAFQECHSCDCSFINNSYDICRAIPFLEAEEKHGSSLSLMNLNWAILKSETVAVLHRLPSPIKTFPYDLFPHL